MSDDDDDDGQEIWIETNGARQLIGLISGDQDAGERWQNKVMNAVTKRLVGQTHWVRVARKVDDPGFRLLCKVVTEEINATPPPDGVEFRFAQ